MLQSPRQTTQNTPKCTYAHMHICMRAYVHLEVFCVVCLGDWSTDARLAFPRQIRRTDWANRTTNDHPYIRTYSICEGLEWPSASPWRFARSVLPTIHAVSGVRSPESAGPWAGGIAGQEDRVAAIGNRHTRCRNTAAYSSVAPGPAKDRDSACWKAGRQDWDLGPAQRRDRALPRSLGWAGLAVGLAVGQGIRGIGGAGRAFRTPAQKAEAEFRPRAIAIAVAQSARA
jgi:hypothetical protein